MEVMDNKKGNVIKNLKGLYVIVDLQFSLGQDSLELTRSVLRGGAKIIQLRDKLTDKGLVLSLARGMRNLCEEYGALFIINDHADLAVACDAHGLHLGQNDLPIKEARSILKPNQIIGKSNALVSEAVDSIGEGADYLAVGAIFPTSTKEKTRPAGLNTLREIVSLKACPVVAIGGIKQANISDVIDAGADAVCVISAVIGNPDPEKATRNLVNVIGA